MMMVFGGTELLGQDDGDKEPKVMEEIIVKDWQGDFNAMTAQFLDLDNWLWFIGWGPTLAEPGPPPNPAGTPSGEPDPVAEPINCDKVEWQMGVVLDEAMETLDQIEGIKENGIHFDEGLEGGSGSGKGIEYGPGSQLVQGVLEGLQKDFEESEKEFGGYEASYEAGDCGAELGPGWPPENPL